MSESDRGFQQLNDDYILLTRSIQEAHADSDGNLEEMITLKSLLEVEALELLSRGANSHKDGESQG